jgi:hypothetical protein
VKEGGGGEGKCERERDWSGDDATALDIEVDPQQCSFGIRKSDFALQVVVFVTVVPNTKLCAWGEEHSGGHVL